MRVPRSSRTEVVTKLRGSRVGEDGTASFSKARVLGHRRAGGKRRRYDSDPRQGVFQGCTAQHAERAKRQRSPRRLRMAPREPSTLPRFLQTNKAPVRRRSAPKPLKETIARANPTPSRCMITVLLRPTTDSRDFILTETSTMPDSAVRSTAASQMVKSQDSGGFQ
jgi:hypothetical protein